jgi:hypothetical protein
VMLQSSSLAFRKPLQYKNPTSNVASVSVFINIPGCRKHFEITYKDHNCPFHAVKSDFSVKVSVVCHTWQWKNGRGIVEAAQMQIRSFVFARSFVFIVPPCSYGLSWWYDVLCSNRISCS